MRTLLILVILSTMILAHSGGGIGIILFFPPVFLTLFVICIVVLAGITHIVLSTDNKTPDKFLLIVLDYFMIVPISTIVLSGTINLLNQVYGRQILNGISFSLVILTIFSAILIILSSKLVTDKDNIPLGYPNAFKVILPWFIIMLISIFGIYSIKM